MSVIAGLLVVEATVIAAAVVMWWLLVTRPITAVWRRWAPCPQCGVKGVHRDACCFCDWTETP